MFDEMTQSSQGIPEAHRRPTPIAGSLLYLVVLVLMLLSSALTSKINIEGDQYYFFMLLIQLVSIGLPVMLYLIWGRKDIKYSLRFGKVSIAEILLAIGMAVFAYGVIIFVNLLWILFLSQFGTPQPAAIPPIETGRQYLMALGVIALTPAVVEEFMFRGVIQRGYEKGGPKVSILLTGIMFAFLHISIVSIPAIIVMGMLLCFIAYRSNSIWTSITYHFVNNGIAITFAYLAGLLTKLFPTDMEGVSGSLSDIPPDQIIVALVAWGFVGFISLVLFGACLAGFLAVTRDKQKTVVASMNEAKGRISWIAVLPVLVAIGIIIALLVFEVIHMVNPAPML